jgi:hypothetical protein
MYAIYRVLDEYPKTGYSWSRVSQIVYGEIGTN